MSLGKSGLIMFFTACLALAQAPKGSKTKTRMPRPRRVLQ